MDEQTDIKNYFTPVTNTSQIVYDAMTQLIGEYKETLLAHSTVIYGAGTRGSLLSLLLEQAGIREFFFTDRNDHLYGHQVNSHPIIDVREIYQRKRDWFILVTPEDSEEIVSELTAGGYQPGVHFINLGGLVSGWLIKEYQKKQQNEVVLLGDCGFLYCSLQDTVKKDLGSILSEGLWELGFPSKRLTMNAVTVYGLYSLMAAQLELGNRPACIIASLDVSSFNGKQQFLPNMQHLDLFEKLYRITPLDSLEEYLSTARQRYQNFSSSRFVPQKTSVAQDPREVANKSYVRTNYMYHFNRENEELHYLLRLVELTKSRQVPILFFLLPVNVAKCRQYWGKEFDRRFMQNRSAVMELLQAKGVPVYDGSALLDETFFKNSGTFDEAASYEGRKQIGKRILERFADFMKEKSDD